MDSKYIKQLLDKYWDGQTSLEEEELLRQYFNDADVADELKPFQPLFRYFVAEQQQALSDQFDASLRTRIEQESGSPAIRRKLFIRISRAAAVLLLFFASFWWITKSQLKSDEKQAINWSEYEEQDPQKALEEVQAALRMISRKMNDGVEDAAEGVGQIQKATKVIK